LGGGIKGDDVEELIFGASAFRELGEEGCGSVTKKNKETPVSAGWGTRLQLAGGAERSSSRKK